MRNQSDDRDASELTLSTTDDAFNRLLIIGLARRQLVARAAGMLAGIVALVVLLLPRTYTASGSFYPQGGSKQFSGVIGLAAQLGVSVPGGDESQSPDFYVALLGSTPILDEMVRVSYPVTPDARDSSLTLGQYYHIKNPDSPAGLALAAQSLKSDLEIRLDGKTGIVGVSFRARDPVFASSVVAKALALVSEFNQQVRQSNARVERQFIEARLAESLGELRSAEDDLQGFLLRNRNWSGSPTLLFTKDRLEREVNLRQSLYTALAQGYDQARIDEVHNTPVITVVAPPTPPALPDSRGLATKGIAALIVGTLGGLALAKLRQGDSPLPSLAEAGSAALADLRRPWRLLGIGR